MKFINLIVDYILNTNSKKACNNEKPTPVYLPCNEIFGNISKKDNSECLNYNYLSTDFIPKNTTSI